MFEAFEVALEIIRSLRPVVPVIRRRKPKLADQIEDAASSIAANVAEGNRRLGRDRCYLFTVAAGSADEVRAHLRVALAWDWVPADLTSPSLKLIDRELGLLWGLTH